MPKIEEINNLGIGTDIESIKRFRKLNRIDDSIFLAKIFTKNELDYCFSKEKAAPHLAVRFTAKEAITKALNTIGKTGLNYNAIEILNDENGIPVVKIHNTNCHNLSIHVSLSHCEEKALAFAIVMDVNSHEKN